LNDKNEKHGGTKELRYNLIAEPWPQRTYHMARPLASLYPQSYGYKKPQAVDDTPDYLRKESRAVARPVQPAAGGSVIGYDSSGGPVMQANTRKPGQMPQAVEDQMIGQNLDRRAKAFDKQESGYAQADRRRAAINENALQVSKLTSREDDYKNMMARPGMPNAPKPRAVVPAVAAPAASPMGSVAPTAQGQPQSNQVPGQPNMQYPASDFAQQPKSIFDTMPQGSGGQSPIAGPVPVPAVIPYSQTFNPDPLAALAKNPSVAVSGPAQDAMAINSNISDLQKIQQQFNGDVGAFKRAQDVQKYNAQMRRPVAVAPPDPRQAFGQMRTQATPQIAAPAGSRLETLRNEVARGQNALDTGSSLEQQRRDVDAAANRKQQVDVAAAMNPPRTVGTASQPKPTLTPEKQALIDANTAIIKTAAADSAEYKDAVKALKGALGDPSSDGFWGKIAQWGGGAKPTQATPPTQQSVDSVVSEIRKANPSWTVEQIKAEAKKRLGS